MIITEKEYKLTGLAPHLYISLKALYEGEHWINQNNGLNKHLEELGYAREVGNNYIPTTKADHIFLHSAEITEVLEHFKTVTGKRINVNSKPNREFVSGRLREGYTKDELKLVIDYQNYLCKNGNFNKTYLRIETLFNPTKFESYIGNASVWDKVETTSNIRMI